MEEKTVHIRAGKGYDVIIGGGIMEKCGELIFNRVGPCRIVVITDTSVGKLYLDTLKKSLEKAGYRVDAYIVPVGEQSKNINTLSEILEFLALSRITRTDCVVALGGGVVGDIAGFAAGCYLRGIRFIQMPTTLLAAVDSSVGGKTGIDLKAGKNLAGVITQPEAVICDTDSLKSLPPDILADGAAEAIKTAVLSNESLFSMFEKGDYRKKLDEIVTQCVKFKGAIVEEDEFETGVRRMLNLGHTVGHAIEKCSDYAVAHGRAVAIGMAYIARASVKLGYCESPCPKRLLKVLEKCGLPVTTDYTAEELTEAALADKKRSGDDITLVIPRGIGHCYLKKIPVTELKAVIEAGAGMES